MINTHNKQIPKMGQLIKVVWEDSNLVDICLVTKVNKSGKYTNVTIIGELVQNQTCELDQILDFGEVIKLKNLWNNI